MSRRIVRPPSAAWTRAAKSAAKRALEPVLRDLGLRGSFPSYRAAGAEQTRVARFDLRIRTGLTLELASLPPRSKQGTSRSEQQRRLVVKVPSTVTVAVLPRKLDAAARRLRREATTFWTACVGHWASDARAERLEAQHERTTIVRALLDGDPAELSRAAHRAPTALANALASVDVRYTDRNMQRSVWACAAVLLRHEAPSYQLAASLVASAVEQLHSKASPSSRALARKVLAWARPQIHRIQHLAAQLGIIASARARSGQCAFASALFELALDGAPPRAVPLKAPALATALYSMLAANRPEPADRKLQHRLLALAVAAAPGDRYVRFNAACLCAELGDRQACIKHLRAALTLRLDPKAVLAQAALLPVHDDPQVSRALRGARAPKPGSRSTAGLLPP